MNLKIFVQDQCPNCPSAKEMGKKLEGEGVDVSYHDIKSIEGLSEAVLFGVMTTPSMIITGEDGEEIHSWKGDVPDIDEVKKKLA